MGELLEALNLERQLSICDDVKSFHMFPLFLTGELRACTGNSVCYSLPYNGTRFSLARRLQESVRAGSLWGAQED